LEKARINWGTADIHDGCKETLEPEPLKNGKQRDTKKKSTRAQRKKQRKAQRKARRNAA